MVEIDEKQIFAILQKAKETGSIKIGANEATKSIERGQAKLIVTATDVSPAEIVAHFPGLCKELKVVFASLGTRAELGAAVGIKSTTAIAVSDAGSAKKELEALAKELLADKKEEVKAENAVADKKETPKVEEAVADKKEEVKAEKAATEE